jgi:polysaccharide biosynthesis transport protein
VDDQLTEDRVNLALASNATPESPEGSSLVAKIRAEESSYAMLLSQYEKARLEAVLRANSISVIEPAVAPARPSKPNIKLNLALAAAVGLLAGLGLAFMYENLVPTIHSGDELVALTKLNLVGRIPKLRRRGRPGERGRDLKVEELSGPAAGPFHTLGLSILSGHSGPTPRTVIISSAEPGAGKSTMTAYLGAALTEIGRQVIIVDGDQPRPSLHRIFDLPLSPGLVDAALDPTLLQRCLRNTRIPGLRVLTAGSPGVDQLAFWHGAKLVEAVKRLAAEADVVIWDTPPVLATVDAKLLAPLADLVLLVVAEDQTTVRQLNLAIEQLCQAGCETPGILYNKTKDGAYGYYSYYHSGSETPPVKHGRFSLNKGTPAPMRREA